MVCGGEGGAAALADGGVVKGRQCARTRVYASTHPFLVSRMCNIEDNLKQCRK